MPHQESSPRSNEPEAGVGDRLESWKEIAAYMGRGVTTVQRWELEEGLPVHRLPHAKKGSVFAFRRELDSWRVTRVQAGAARPLLDRPAGVETLSAPPSQPGWLLRPMVWVTTGCLGLALVTVIARYGFGRTPPRLGGEGVAARAVPRPLANDVAPEYSPSLSPDGTHVVYDWVVGGVTGLYIKPVDGGSPAPVPIGGDIRLPDSAHAKWSPRGDRIAFLSSRGPQQYGLYLVPPTGGTPHFLTLMAGIGLCWHPDGSSIGFIDRTDQGKPFAVFSIVIETGERRRLTVPPDGAFGDTHCSFSEDGSQLAVIRHSTRGASDIYVADVATPSRMRRVTVDGPPMTGLSWAPDGQSIVFGGAGLWKVATNTRGIATPSLIAGAEGETRYPSFSRSGPTGFPRLAYEYSVFDVNIWRWERLPDGSEKTYRLPGSTVWDDLPAFSADGRRIAFVSNRTGKIQVWIANADGSNSRQVTFEAFTSTSPQWSPDGQQLAFSSEVGGNWDIYVMRADASETKRLTVESSQEVNPSWSRDGEWIYFRSDRTGVNQIWKLRVDGGKPVRVTSGQGSEAFEGPGKVLYYVRHDNAPGLWSVPVDGGAETPVLSEVEQHLWGVADNGIAFVTQSSDTSPKASIKFLTFATGRISTLTVLPTPKAMSGFSIARDGRSALWPQVDTSLNDLMLIDSWKQ